MTEIKKYENPMKKVNKKSKFLKVINGNFTSYSHLEYFFYFNKNNKKTFIEIFSREERNESLKNHPEREEQGSILGNVLFIFILL